MPIIRVEMFTGRSRDQKRELVKELTDTFIRVAGGKPETVTVVITDVEKENWGSGGNLVVDRFPGE
ncbi:MAG: 4-oxalocrotonate tautomerase [Saprospiraceae bacterium]|jgi:4-oxalocrotonate tautomerase